MLGGIRKEMTELLSDEVLHARRILVDRHGMRDIWIRLSAIQARATDVTLDLEKGASSSLNHLFISYKLN